MKKRILSMLLAIVMVVGMMPGLTLTAQAATLSDTFTVSDMTYTVTLTSITRISNGASVIDEVTETSLYTSSRNGNTVSFYISVSPSKIGNYPVTFTDSNCSEALTQTKTLTNKTFKADITITRKAASHKELSCDDSSKCSLCGTSAKLDHSTNGTYNSDGTYHWLVCSNDSSHQVNKAACSGGTATCETQAICTTCKNAYGANPSGHTWVWSNDGATHWQECTNTGCDAKQNEDACSGGKAYCREKAICDTCNLEYGYYADSHPESAITGYIQIEINYEDHHKFYCSMCEEWRVDARLCEEIVGYVDCANPATCVCGRKIYSVDHDYGAWASNGDGTHTRNCIRNCGAYETQNCTGGTPTCAAAAVCSVCEKSYGSKAAHSLTYGVQNGTTNALVESCNNSCGHSAKATLSATDQTYTGSAHTPATIIYSDNWAGSDKPTEIGYTNNTNVGTAEATIIVEGHELSTTFQITAASIADAAVTLNPESGTYTGTAYAPEISAVYNGKTLVEDTDYTVSWDKTDLTDEGTYTATVTGKGNFSGTTSKEFTVNAASLSNITVAQVGTLTYTGEAQTPTVSASATAVNGQTVTFTYLYEDEESEDDDGGRGETYGVLPQFTDAGTYTVKYKASAPNHEASYGEFTVTVDKADNTWTTIPSINGWTYGETANAPTYEAKFGDVKVTYTGKANDDSDYNSETAPTKAGSYTANFTVENTDNYGGLSASVDFTIARAPVTHIGTDKTATYTPDMVIDLREMFVVDQNAGEASYNITALTGSGSFTNAPYLYRIDKAGTFTVLFSTKMTATHSAGIARTVLTINPADPAIGTVSANVVENTLETSAIVLTRENTNIPGTLTVDAEQTLALGDNEIKYTFTPTDTDNYTTVTGTVNVTLVDTQAPTGKVYFDERNGWESFLNTITFGLFYKDEVTVKVDATDKLSGVAKIEYFAADKAMTFEEVKAITTWTAYENGVAVTVEDAKQFVYFVRITDNAGNVTYLSTDGAEYDITAPAISGIENGETYYTTQKVTVTGKNIESITLNGEAAAENITLDGNKEAAYTIVATDKAGNVTTYTVTMKPIADVDTTIDGITGDDVTSDDKETVQDVIDEIDELLKDEDLTADEKAALEEIKDNAEKLVDKIEEADAADETENIKKVEDVTAENVTPEDKTDLEKAKEDLEKALEDNGDNYTDDEKKAIEDELERVEYALEVIENVENVEELIDKLPETITKDDEAAIKAAEDAYNALTDYEKSFVDKAAKKALEAAKAALAQTKASVETDTAQSGKRCSLWLWLLILLVLVILAIIAYDRKRRRQARNK